MRIEEWKEYNLCKMGKMQGVYEVSNFGNFRRNGVNFVPKPNKRGYVASRSGGKTVKGHNLVWDAFGDKKRTGKLVVNHKDNVKNNNHIDNLELVTQLENVRHAVNTVDKSVLCGELNPRSVLSDDDILLIRFIGHTVPKKHLANQFGCSRITISRIISGRRNTSFEPVVRYNHQLIGKEWRTR